jgi:hypothetical protein
MQACLWILSSDTYIINLALKWIWNNNLKNQGFIFNSWQSTNRRTPVKVLFAGDLFTLAGLEKHLHIHGAENHPHSASYIPSLCTHHFRDLFDVTTHRRIRSLYQGFIVTGGAYNLTIVVIIMFIFQSTLQRVCTCVCVRACVCRCVIQLVKLGQTEGK